MSQLFEGTFYCPDDNHAIGLPQQHLHESLHGARYRASQVHRGQEERRLRALLPPAEGHDTVLLLHFWQLSCRFVAFTCNYCIKIQNALHKINGHHRHRDGHRQSTRNPAYQLGHALAIHGSGIK